jgi:hypothetical protein
MASQVPIHQQHDLRRGKRGDRDQNHSGHHQVEPSEQRHAVERHSRAAEAHNCRDKIDGCADASETGDEKSDRPVVRAGARRKRSRRQRRVCPPAHVRRVAGAIKSVPTQETEIKENASQGCEPETERIQAGKGHVARADHYWDEIVGKTKQDRHGHEENHGGAMHGKHAIENLR